MSKTKSIKNNIKTGTTTAFTISQIFVLLYLLVGFVPLFGAMDYDAPEWLYVSIINVLALGFIYKSKEELKAFLVPKHVKWYFAIFVGFFLIGCLSMITAINVSESLVHLARLMSMIGAFYCLYIFIRQDPESFFDLICKIVIIILICFSWRAVSYFFGNYDSPRISQLITDFPHDFSSINIYTAFLVVQIPFASYGFLCFKKIWKYAAGLAVFMSVISLFFVGSRTALLSFSIFYVLMLILLFYGVFKEKKGFKKEVILLTLLPLVSVLLMLNINRINSDEMNSLKDITKTSSIEVFKANEALLSNENGIKDLLPKNDGFISKYGVDSGRFSLWSLAFDKFKENPILGVGYGNYKAVAKKEHYKTVYDADGDFKNPRRAHNDFMEKLAETGIIGFVLFVMLFLFPLWLFIKIWKKEPEFEKRFLYGVLIFSAIAYTIDALLNFPMERAPVQLYFLLLVVFILCFYRKENDELSEVKNGFGLLFFILLGSGTIMSVFSNYLVLDSYQLQRSMREDLMGKTLFTDQKLKYSYDEIKEQWSDYPELSYVGTVNNVFLANYAIKARKYEEALEILNKSKDYNKDAFLVKAFKAEIHLNVYDNIDSAMYYSENIFDGYPAFKTNYNLLKGLYKKKKDTVRLMNIMDRYTNVNIADVNEWEVKANTVYQYTKDSEAMLKVLDSGLLYHQSSLKLLKVKKEVLDKLKFKSYLKNEEVKEKHQLAFDFFKVQKYNEAKVVFEEILTTNPNDYLSIQNIGIIYLVQKKYKEAVKKLSVVIDANAFGDGKSEYSRGYCYEQLGDLEKSKRDYKSSRNKNYSQAMSLPASKYE